MKEYHKIQTIYKRDIATNNKTLLEGKYSLPEFEYLRKNTWVFTEKVDGTNIRIKKEGNNLSYGGKTDNAQIPTKLLDALNSMFSFEKLKEVFKDTDVCLYGEGYGVKIQGCGGNYLKDSNSFCLFDIKIGEFWLNRPDIEDIAKKLGLTIAPIIGEGTLDDMVDMCRKGFNSQWGDFIAEGIVARPKIELKARNGDRIITKLKYKDFIRV